MMHGMFHIGGLNQFQTNYNLSLGDCDDCTSSVGKPTNSDFYMTRLCDSSFE